MSDKWNEYYKNDEIRKIQAIELESFKVFIELCEKLNVNFFVYGGTLLGAVKYYGFVPWDDDLDLAMMRDDYDKLIKEGPKILNDLYEIQHPKINKVTPFPYIKFRRKDTTLVEEELHKLKMNHGIYFDIYPIDHIPDDDNLYKKENDKLKTINKFFYLRQVRPLKHFGNKKGNSKFKILIKVIIHYLLKIVPHSYFTKRMNKIMTKYNKKDTKRYGNYFYPKPVNYFNGIYPFEKFKFEGFTVNVPSGYKVNLKNRYGDITILPPENERIGHKAYLLKFPEGD